MNATPAPGMTTQSAARTAAAAPTRGMTVLYDPDCPLCVRAWRWFSAQPTFFPVRFVPQGTAAADERFPQLRVGEDRPVEDLIVVTDAGNVYRNTRAWIMCFYALRKYRPLAFRLSHPALMPLARRAYHAVSNNRMWLGRYFGPRDRRISNPQLADRIRTHSAPTDDGCHIDPSNPANVTACVVQRLNERRADTQPQPGDRA